MARVHLLELRPGSGAPRKMNGLSSQRAAQTPAKPASGQRWEPWGRDCFPRVGTESSRKQEFLVQHSPSLNVRSAERSFFHSQNQRVS